MTRDFADVEPRSLSGWKTAYPRVSRLGTDPDNGLASVEALTSRYHLLGLPTAGLLDHYRWAGEFLAANGAARRRSTPRGRGAGGRGVPRRGGAGEWASLIVADVPVPGLEPYFGTADFYIACSRAKRQRPTPPQAGLRVQ